MADETIGAEVRVKAVEDPWAGLNSETQVNLGSLTTAIKIWGDRNITPEERAEMEEQYHPKTVVHTPELSLAGSRDGKRPKIANRGVSYHKAKFKDIDGKTYDIPVVLLVRPEDTDGVQVQHATMSLDDRKLHPGSDSFPLSSKQLAAPVEVLARFGEVMRDLAAGHEAPFPKPPLKTDGHWKNEGDYSKIRPEQPTVMWGDYNSKVYGKDPDHLAGRMTTGFGQTAESFGKALELGTNGNIVLK